MYHLASPLTFLPSRFSLHLLAFLPPSPLVSPDPHSVLQLLQSALSMDKLAALLQSEYCGDTEQLEALQGQLEGRVVDW